VCRDIYGAGKNVAAGVRRSLREETFMQRALRAGLVAGVVSLAFVPAANAAQKYVEGQVIVKYAPGASNAQRGSAGLLAGVTKTLRAVRGTGAEVVNVSGSVSDAVARLNKSSAVLYAEPNYIYHALATPNDPQYANQDDLNNSGQLGGTADADIDAPEGWDLGGLGAFPATGGAKVGIVDTGIMQTHEDLAGRTSDCGGVNNFGMSLVIIIVGADPTIGDGKCADDNGHGSHVAGTIGATTNNGKGIAGIAFNSPLAICKALNSSGSGTLEMVANCITWVNQHGAKVISMSLGGTSDSTTLHSAVTNATNNGSLIVAAAGNGGNATVNYPAGYPEVVSVAATDNKDAHASFSTFNPDVEIAAPGVNELSSYNDGGYRRLSGTSMATPHVAAVAALIAGRNPSGGPAAWRTKLDSSVDDLGPAGRDVNFGFGRVNLAKALS
jgi:thermitase